MTVPLRFRPDDLIRYAEQLFVGVGTGEEQARTMAEVLVAGDLLGHDTHGLYLADTYLKELEVGGMRKNGAPKVVNDTGATIVWDGLMLPGTWLTMRAIDLALDRSVHYGMAAVCIRASHHAACLQAYLERATSQNRIILLMSSDLSMATVAPYNGIAPVFTPNPIALGIPTGGDPILIDMSMSIKAIGATAQLYREAKEYPGEWALDAKGIPTRDPGVIFQDPPGTILPIGGLDHGYKGFAFALMVETFTQALSGFGRADAPPHWVASVFVMVLNPAAFNGVDACLKQTGFIADLCHKSPPRPGTSGVRLPGERALVHRREALRSGLSLSPDLLSTLQAWAHRLEVPEPRPVDF